MFIFAPTATPSNAQTTAPTGSTLVHQAVNRYIKHDKTISNKFFAIIGGTSEGKYLTSLFIKDEKKPKVGDLLLTSGNTKTFPQDILVGKVINVKEDNFLVIPYVDFDNIEFVQVIDVN